MQNLTVQATKRVVQPRRKREVPGLNACEWSRLDSCCSSQCTDSFDCEDVQNLRRRMALLSAVDRRAFVRSRVVQEARRAYFLDASDLTTSAEEVRNASRVCSRFFRWALQVGHSMIKNSGAVHTQMHVHTSTHNPPSPRRFPTMCTFGSAWLAPAPVRPTSTLGSLASCTGST